MAVVICVSCEKQFLKPLAKPSDDILCGGCYTDIQRDLNQIDREYDQTRKRSQVKKLLSGIPHEALDDTILQMAEEIADQNVKTRHFCIGRLEEIEMGDTGIQRL